MYLMSEDDLSVSKSWNHLSRIISSFLMLNVDSRFEVLNQLLLLLHAVRTVPCSTVPKFEVPKIFPKFENSKKILARIIWNLKPETDFKIPR